MILLQWKIFLLTLLYFIQGIPYGFQSRFLPVYLRNLGQSLTSLSLYKLLLTPWLCKALWAPLVDKYGNQKLWLIVSIFGLSLVCLLCAFIEPSSIKILSALLFLMNILAAMQDISVDRLALEVLADGELGIGNSVQVVGYKFGALFGGGVMLYMIENTGWMVVFMMLACLYFGVTVFILFRPIDIYITSDPVTRKGNKTDLGYWTILRSVLDSRGTIWMLGYLLIYKLGEQGALSMLPLYLVDHGMTMGDIAVWTGMLGQAVSIIGSTMAGYLLSNLRLEPYGLIKRLFLVQCLPLLLLYAITASEYEVRTKFGLAISAMYVLLLISGLVTTATFTTMMQTSRLAPSSVRATHYSLLASVEIFGKLTFASLSGYLTDLVGYDRIFLLFIVLSCLVPVYLATRKEDYYNYYLESSEEKKDGVASSSTSTSFSAKTDIGRGR